VSSAELTEPAPTVAPAHGCEHTTAEHHATRRLTGATWALVIATIALVIVTAMLALKTEHESHAPAEPSCATSQHEGNTAP
jgi:hypothetical protein